jgi:hypothetical protein
MSTLPANHLARIANFYSTKLRELRYFLRIIVDNCDESLRRANTLEANTDPTAGPVTFSFSAFTNTIQTLKDMTNTLKPGALSWKKIEELRHGRFMYLVRNAMTHDGNPVIFAWADGHYFVPSKIVRADDKGNVKVIHPPTEDLRKFCLEFSFDYLNLLTETLQEIPDSEKLSMSIFDIDELDEFYENNEVVPEFAIKMFIEQRAEIEEVLKSQRVPRIENAAKLAQEIASYCDEKLGFTPISPALTESRP